MKSNPLSTWEGRGDRRVLYVYTCLSFLLAGIGYVAAEISFADSRYPVSLLEGQLSFDGEVIRSHYAVLMAQGTFRQFFLTQIIDFAFIAGLMLFLYFVHLAIALGQRTGSFWQKLALRLSVIAPAIAFSDALENVVSFAMLADPTNFPDWMAVLYSSLAAIKWSWAAFGTTLVMVQLAVLWFSRIVRGSSPENGASNMPSQDRFGRQVMWD